MVGKSNTDSPEECQGKTGVEPCLGMLMQAAHVSHGIKHGDNPQERRCQGKDHGKGIDPEGHAQAGEDFKNSTLQHIACQDIRHHGGDDQENDHCRNG